MMKNLGLKNFKIEIQKGGPHNSYILQNWFPLEIRSPLFNLYKFQDSEKSLLHSFRMDWNLINDEKFGTTELLTFKYNRGDQIIQIFCKIGSPQKLFPPYLICRNLKSLRELLVNHTKCIESYKMARNLGLKIF